MAALFVYTDFDKAISILEKKLEGRENNASRRQSPTRQSGQFNIIQTRENEEGEMIDPSMLAGAHMAQGQRKPSFILMKTSKSGKVGSGLSTHSGSREGSLENRSATGAAAAGMGFPSGAAVPAAYYK